MLNFLCDAIGDIEELFPVLGVFIVLVIGVINMIIKAKKHSSNASNDDDNTYPFGNHPNSSGQLTPEQRRYQTDLQQRKGAQKPHTPTVSSADGHGHNGQVETYEPIVGSLGAVDDEGCDDLNGVRLIATDLMYETDDNETAYDLAAIRKSIILGEVLNNPRFKKPYSKK